MAAPAILSEADRAQVSAAVCTAEALSAGEIATILTELSDDYADVALVWSALVALVALAVLALLPGFWLGLFDRVFGTWGQDWHPGAILALAASVAAIVFCAMWLVLRSRPLRLALVPGWIKHDRVRARALTCFRVGAEQRTAGRTGILIYLSMAEHRAEIVAEEAIAAKVPAEVWGEAMAAMLGQLKAGRVAAGLCLAVDRVGVVLADHFPRSPDDRNEIPDRLIEV